MVVRRQLLPVACLAVAACGGGRSDAPSGAAAARQASQTAVRPGGPACPKTGQWAECHVFARLEQAGVAPRRGGTVADLPNLGIAPVLYSIGTSGLAVYFFADTSARTRAARALDTLHFVAPAASLTMRGEATAIQNGNLLGLLFSRNDQQRERVSDALMAGAPQP